jgi:RNA polymerase sigma-70 factor (ECF subfamily)
MSATEDVTQLLNALNEGDAATVDRLFGLVYEELRAVSAGCLRNERPDHTLQPTALVNEVFLRLIKQTQIDWKNRAHFLAVAASAMRQVLIDHARGRKRVKRGGPAQRVAMADAITPIADADPELLDLEEALQRLATMDPRQSRIVELRFFGGMTVEEIAHVLGVSRSTVEAEWRMARAWLRRELTSETTD